MHNRTQDEWIVAYKRKGALWLFNYGSNPRNRHAKLASEKHSDGFFNSRLVIADEPLLREAAFDLVSLYVLVGANLNLIDCVVGPQTGATKLAEFVAAEISVRRGRSCDWASPTKAWEGTEKKMLFDTPEKMRLSGKVVLLVEDVLTTGGSVALTNDAVVNAGATVLDFVLVLVNRSGLPSMDGHRVVALINRAMPMWTPEACPLCKHGSTPVRPKDNWSELITDYPRGEEWR